MLTLTNLVDGADLLRPYDEAALAGFLADCGLDGFEAIRCGEHAPQLNPALIGGVHLLFWSDWVDFWRGDTRALTEKFGTRAAWEDYYGCKDREGLLAQFRADLGYARQMGAKYVVFHVSDVSPEETLTARRLHSDAEVIDASAELLNALFDGMDAPFELLLENLWWSGFTMADPAMTERLLARVNYPRTGILLDTGHLFNADPSLPDAEACIAYAHRMLDAHGALSGRIRGVHLHGAATGSAVRELLAAPPALAADFPARFAQAYDAVLRMDPHCPLIARGVRGLVERIDPEYLVFEFASRALDKRRMDIIAQRAALEA